MFKPPTTMQLQTARSDVFVLVKTITWSGVWKEERLLVVISFNCPENKVTACGATIDIHLKNYNF